ncbi:MAG: ABC transporter ATP-binding protein [Deltaproteobacteria bacterium]
MSTIIKVENLGKKYIISHQRNQRYVALRDVMTETAKKLGSRIINPFSKGVQAHASSEEFWALKDISFEINQGDRVGIIGRNGAGKSTLLKLLSRITEPTTGRISLKGRVASLLEVGTGFHPELTGRENIYLNGAVLGMTNVEIKKKFDEIVEFAEVEKFLDTPVKRYSSGMYMRLAFAVAAHLEPEILVVDEVLAVGDAQFQKKCLGKMEEVGKEGRTVLFVSHNMGAVQQLCTRGILLEKGKIKSINNNVSSIIKEYTFDSSCDLGMSCWTNSGKEFINPWFKPIKMSITDEKGDIINSSVNNNSDFWIQIEGEVEKLDPALTVGYAIYTQEGTLLYWSYQTDGDEEKWPKLKKGYCILKSQIPKRFLNERTYRIELIGSLHCKEWLFQPEVNAPSILLRIEGGLSDSPHWMFKRPGAVAPVMEWDVK